MSYAVSAAASAVRSLIKDATMRDLITANKFIKMSKSKDVISSFPKIDDVCKHAPFANLKCDGSQGGLLVFLEASDRRYMLLTWQS